MPQGIFIRTKEYGDAISIGRKKSEKAIQTSRENIKKAIEASRILPRSQKQIEQIKSLPKLPQTIKSRIKNFKKGWALPRSQKQITSYKKNFAKGLGLAWKLPRTQKQLESSRKTAKMMSGLPRTEKWISRILASVCKHPNKFENNVKNYLNAIYPKKFKYSGNGTFIKEGRSVDFYSKELKQVILANGDYIHCNPNKYAADFYNKLKNKTAQEIWNYDKETVRRYENLGYKVIVIWENDLNNLIKKEDENGRSW